MSCSHSKYLHTSFRRKYIRMLHLTCPRSNARQNLCADIYCIDFTIGTRPLTADAVFGTEHGRGDERDHRVRWRRRRRHEPVPRCRAVAARRHDTDVLRAEPGRIVIGAPSRARRRRLVVVSAVPGSTPESPFETDRSTTGKLTENVSYHHHQLTT